MGLDMGDKRIGIAVSDLLMLTAQGVESYTRTESEKKDIAHLCEICAQYNVGKIVCGLPKNMNGTLGPMAEKVQAFAEKLKKASGLEIEFEDERLTTVYAERLLLQADMSLIYWLKSVPVSIVWNYIVLLLLLPIARKRRGFTT